MESVGAWFLLAEVPHRCGQEAATRNDSQVSGGHNPYRLTASPTPEEIAACEAEKAREQRELERREGQAPDRGGQAE